MSDRPYKVDSGPPSAREGNIPYWAKWSDGSFYRVEMISDALAERTFGGPMFELPGQSKSVRFDVNHCDRR